MSAAPTNTPPDSPASTPLLAPPILVGFFAEFDRGAVRSTLTRLVVVALAFASINGALSSFITQGDPSDHWYLYLSPVLVAALSFGLRGGLLAAAAAVVALVTLDTKFTAVMAAEQQRLIAMLSQIIPSSESAGRAALVVTLPADVAMEIARRLQNVTAGSVHLLGAVVTLCLTGGIVGWQVDQGRRRARAALELANRDALTGTFSRWLWRDWLDDEARRSARYDRVFTLLLLDIDRLRDINGQLGRNVGDTALLELADAVYGHVRTVDRLGRLGGDEFGLLLPETDRAGGVVVAERLLRAMEVRLVKLEDGRLLELGLSIGLVTFPAAGANGDALLAASKRALRRAKAQGGRCWSGLPDEAGDPGAASEPQRLDPKPLTGPRIITPEASAAKIRRRKTTFSRLRW